MVRLLYRLLVVAVVMHFSLKRKGDDLLVAKNCVLANTAWSRMKGLLAHKKMESNEALVIEPCNSVHTFFMRFPIDVFFLDQHWHVLGIAHSLKPWRLSKIFFSAKRVVEMQAGTAHRLALKKGDELCLNPII